MKIPHQPCSEENIFFQSCIGTINGNTLSLSGMTANLTVNNICYIKLKRKKNRLVNISFFFTGLLVLIFNLSKNTAIPILYFVSLLCIALSFTMKAKKTYLRIVVRDPGVIDVRIKNIQLKEAKKFIRKFEKYLELNPHLSMAS